MRMRLTLMATQPKTTILLNYNYAVTALIYKTIGNASTEYAARLHDEGYEAEYRRFKLFTFSRIETIRKRRLDDKLLLEDPKIFLCISSPVVEFIENFVSGLFQTETFSIAGAQFRLLEAETLPQPEFTNRMKFQALSPITESIRDEQNRSSYLSPEDDWSGVIQRNLLRKYFALHGRMPSDDRLKWKWDREYLDELTRKGRRASAMIKIPKAGLGRPIDVRGWLAPFTVEGNVELMELGYTTGFGARNSMGFGMAEVGSVE
jgi:CRISPR-associated endoribonuclease Cas6